MGSNRLPNKVLLDLAGKTMLERVVDRVKAIERLDSIVIATTTDPEDERIEREAKRLEVEVYRGHPTDVLDRFHSTAKAHNADAIMRVTADCPLLDPQIAANIIDTFLKTNSDYCSNLRQPTYPDGLDVELLTAQALETCWNDADLDSDREHVATYIRLTRSDRFTIENVENEVDLSDMRWTIDEPDDLDFMRALLPELEINHGTDTGFIRVLEVLSEHPEIARINSSISRNEGWMHSLADDQSYDRSS
jgi:spore coat polysaccharide biosynthesis protein SpsF (cytidylyltransferase family)